MMTDSNNVLDLIEDSNDFIEDGEFNNDLQKWRKFLYRFKKSKQQLQDLIEAKNIFQKRYDEAIEKAQERVEAKNIFQKRYDEAIEKAQERVSYLESLCESHLKDSSYKTSTGGFKFDLCPDLGIVSLQKERVSFDLENDDSFIDKGFYRTVPESKVLDKKSVNEYLKKCVVDGDVVIDQSTGEVVEGVIVKRSRTLKVDL
jgi:hypothetical protein